MSQIAYAFSQAEGGTAVADLCRQLGHQQCDLLRVEEKIRFLRGD